MGGLHAKKSPSGSKIWHGCAGSLAATETLPEEMRNSSGEAARRGTAAHLLLETTLREQTPPESFEGRIVELIYTPDGDEEAVMLKPRAKAPKGGTRVWFEVDEDMIANVALAFNYIAERCAELGVPMGDLLLETRTNPCPERDDTSGTADVTIDAWPLWLEVVDYKNGRLVVEHKDNPQLLAYLAGKAEDTGWLHDNYRIAVVQPNGRHEEGKVRPFDVTKEELQAFVVKHRAAAEAADRAAEALFEVDYHLDGILSPVSINERGEEATFADAYLTPGDHCEWCPVALLCPSYKRYAREVARDDFTGTPDPKNAGPMVEATEEAIRIKKAEPFLRALIRKANAQLNAEARAGRMPADLKYIRAKSDRRWILGDDDKPIPPALLVRKIVEAGYLDEEKASKLFAPADLISGPKAEKLVTTKEGLRKKFAAEFLYAPPGGLKLVPRDSAGEEVVVSAADDFKEEEESEDEDY